MNEQNISQAKFLVKELSAILDMLTEDDYDEELNELLGELSFKIKDEL